MTADLSTLIDRVEAAASGSGAVTFLGSSEPDRVSWTQLHDEARGMAAGLQARGVGPGAHVALLGMTSRLFVTAIQATWLTGAAVIALPLPMRLGSLEEFVSQTRTRVRQSDTDLLLVDGDLAAFVEPAPGDPPTALLPDVASGSAGAEAYERPVIEPGSLAVLQFTSGSTADPKGVMLPHAQVCANLDGMAAAARLAPDDVLVSWLPLYHDMGLIGLLTLPMTTGATLVQAAPHDFLAAPARWMQWMHDFGGTATAGPNFSYALAARALGRMGHLDLSRWRIALNGAEPVDPAAVDAFCAAGGPHRLDPRSAFPAFGMAEATLGVTFPEPMRGLRVDTVDRMVLETERRAVPVGEAGPADTTRRLARLGRAVPGVELRITDAVTGKPMGEREAGELEIRGNSLTPGYYKHPEATAAAFRDGWFRTGDVGYLVDGELVVCGRLKDVIIVGGRNVFPEDIERAAAAVEGVRAGNVIAFGVEGRKGREGLVVVAETKASDPSPVRSAVAQRVRQAVGVGPEDVVLVAPGSLPKTSSGKLQRSLCRSRYLEAGLQLV